MAIFNLRCKQGGYVLDGDASDEVEAFINRQNVDPIIFGNARGIRNLFEQVLIAQSNRLVKESEITREKLMQITAQDVLDASAAAVEKQKAEQKSADEELMELLRSLRESTKPKADEPEKPEENRDEEAETDRTEDAAKEQEDV